MQEVAPALERQLRELEAERAVATGDPGISARPHGEDFYRCTDVPPVRLASVADVETKVPTGWVEAVYGAIRTGNGDKLYGWLVSSHRHGSEPVVMHLER